VTEVVDRLGTLGTLPFRLQERQTAVHIQSLSRWGTLGEVGHFRERTSSDEGVIEERVIVVIEGDAGKSTSSGANLPPVSWGLGGAASRGGSRHYSRRVRGVHRVGVGDGSHLLERCRRGGA